MSALEDIGLKFLHRFDPERAHGLSIQALKWGLAPLHGGPVTSPRLTTSMGGIALANPVGLAAGYDKNAQTLGPLSKAGFGFLEVGAATPRPQVGNPKPRLFRLTQDHAAINRFGFNNQGIDAIARRLAQTATTIPRGLNLGANKDSADRADDFGHVLSLAAPYIDFATVNISSPNTEKLRDLQGRAALEDLLGRVNTANALLARPIPIFLKIAPDLTDAEIQDIADLALAAGLSAIICTNTTLDRNGLNSSDRDQKGGLSGRPLFKKSTRVLAKMRAATAGKIDLVGVGGIGSAEDAYAKIQAGACAVQLYSAMVYQGLSLVPKIARGMDQLLATDGVEQLTQAIGVSTENWL
jgi:dihydroorotate dehydrogenase